MAFNQDANPHNYCVVRNCIGRGSMTVGLPAIPLNIFGIAPGAGRGTILENNQLINVASGITDLGSAESTLDLIVRDNYFRNVSKAIGYSRPAGAAAVGRYMAWNNVIEVGTSQTNKTGIALLSSGGTYASAVLRKNIIRDSNWPNNPMPPVITGIQVQSVTDLDIESNIIDYSPSGSRIMASNSKKIFNNSDGAGGTVPP